MSRCGERCWPGCGVRSLTSLSRAEWAEMSGWTGRWTVVVAVEQLSGDGAGEQWITGENVSNTIEAAGCHRLTPPHAAMTSVAQIKYPRGRRGGAASALRTRLATGKKIPNLPFFCRPSECPALLSFPSRLHFLPPSMAHVGRRSRDTTIPHHLLPHRLPASPPLLHTTLLTCAPHNILLPRHPPAPYPDKPATAARRRTTCVESQPARADSAVPGDRHDCRYLSPHPTQLALPGLFDRPRLPNVLAASIRGSVLTATISAVGLGL